MAQKSRSGRTAGGRKTQGSRGSAKRGGARGAGKGGMKTAARKTAGRPARSGRATGARGRSKSSGRPRSTRRPATRAAGGGGRGGRAGPKWIDSPEEHADRPGQTLMTRNHDVIRQWAEERGAQPATTGNRHDGRPGVLRFDFPGYGGGRLEHISWDDWFRTFDERDLVFVYQERLKSGRPSNFFRLDNPARRAAA